MPHELPLRFRPNHRALAAPARLRGRARLSNVSSLAGALALLGCGAGAPLLHPVHPLAPGKLAGSSGVSAHFAPPDAQRAIDRTSRASVDERAQDEQAAVDGALAQTLSAPGLAPWFSIRAGLVEAAEGGISYTGRRARADLRYAYVMDQTAFSVGAGATGIMPAIGADPPTQACDDPELCPDPIVDDTHSEIPGVDTGSTSGWGLDLPLLVGWRSDPGIVAFWTGVRARFEQISGEIRYETGAGPRTAHAEGDRWVFQGVVGFSVGIKPIWALFELSPAYERLSGNVNLESGVMGSRLEGFSFSPAIALMIAP
ncbi:MAG TPA: hypothetical protein VI197_27120 [Polyangiaceae bacterium]